MNIGWIVAGVVTVCGLPCAVVFGRLVGLGRAAHLCHQRMATELVRWRWETETETPHARSEEAHQGFLEGCNACAEEIEGMAK